MHGSPTSPSTGLIAKTTQFAIARPGLLLSAAAALTAVSVWLASGLEIRSSFEELLPSDVPSVAQVKQLVKRVGGDGTVLVLIESLDGPSGLPRAEALAKELAPELIALGPQTIRAVDYDMRPIERWYEEHWPLFVGLEDLEKARDTVRDEVKKRKAAANPLAVQLDDEEAGTRSADDPPEWMDPKKPLPRELVAQRFERYVDGFMVHPDKKSLTMVIRPTGTSLGVDAARGVVDRIQAVIDRHADELKQGRLRVGLGGTFPMFIAEYEGIKKDVFGTAALVASLVIFSILLFFRDLRSTGSLGLAILVAVAITFGLTRLVIGYLNTQTAFLGAIVVGNGINYGLIYLARVRQLRWRGEPLLTSCVEGARETARATLLASAATSVAFGTLIIAANRGFRHFGFIGGIGMLLCWVSTFVLVPAFLSLFEKLRGAPKLRAAPDNEGLVGPLGKLFAGSRFIVGLFAVLTVVSLVLFVRQIPTVMERNLDNLSNELKGQTQLQADNQRANDALGKSLAGAVALLDSWEQADAFCGVVRQRMKEPPFDKLIDGCDTLSSVVPRQQPGKLAILREIVAELPDSVLRKVPDAVQRERLRVVRDQLAAQRTVSAEEAPHTLLDRFRERDGTLGRIAAATAKPAAHIEEEQNLENFVRAIRGVPVDGRTVDATGANVIFADLLRNIEHEGPRTTFISFFGVCVLVFVFFRRLGESVLVAGTLLVGVILMCGAAAAVHLKINFFNFIVFPITFGVAVDYGANVVARVKERGGDVLRAMAEVGPAVALCSWTSIIGYGSLLMAANRALRSFGWYAMVGEVTTIVTALVLLPALLLMPRRTR